MNPSVRLEGCMQAQLCIGLVHSMDLNGVMRAKAVDLVVLPRVLGHCAWLALGQNAGRRSIGFSFQVNEADGTRTRNHRLDRPVL